MAFAFALLYLVACWLISTRYTWSFTCRSPRMGPNRLSADPDGDRPSGRACLFAWAFESPRGAQTHGRGRPEKIDSTSYGPASGSRHHGRYGVAIAYFVTDKFWLSRRCRLPRASKRRPGSHGAGPRDATDADGDRRKIDRCAAVRQHERRQDKKLLLED